MSQHCSEAEVQKRFVERMFAYYISRYEQLGFDKATAESLTYGMVDYRSVRDLVNKGCDLSTALRIVL